MQRLPQILSLGSALVLVVWTACSNDETAVGSSTIAVGTGPGSQETVTTTSTGGSTSVSTGGASECNPVTNEGCDRGEACDTNFNKKSFECFPPPNDNEVCTECGPQKGWCQPTFTCHEGNCAKFCCNDGDCGPEGYCELMPLEGFDGGPVGVCLLGAGGEGGSPGVDCSPPVPSPSQGTCFEGVGGAGGMGGSGGSGGSGGIGGTGGTPSTGGTGGTGGTGTGGTGTGGTGGN